MTGIFWKTWPGSESAAAPAWQDVRGRFSVQTCRPRRSARAPPRLAPARSGGTAGRGAERGRAAGAELGWGSPAGSAAEAPASAACVFPAEHGGVPVPAGVRQVHSRAQQRCLRGRGGGAASGGEPVRQSLGGRVRAGGVEKPSRAEPPRRRQGGCGLGVPGGHPQLLLLVRAGGAEVPCEVQG